MAVTISKTTVIENIYKNFYDLVVAISGFSTIVYPTYPDIEIDSKSDYPFVIIESPELEWTKFTFGKGVVEGTISISIYTNTPKDSDQKASKVSNKIEISKHDLADVGLKQVNLTSTSSDMAPHGKIKVYLKTLTFSYKFYYDSTRAY